jgi:hypothetical protein
MALGFYKKGVYSTYYSVRFVDTEIRPIMFIPTHCEVPTSTKGVGRLNFPYIGVGLTVRWRPWMEAAWYRFQRLCSPVYPLYCNVPIPSNAVWD